MPGKVSGADWNCELLRVTRQAFLVAGMVAACGLAGAQQQAIPDAQVEANVLKALATAPELANQQITTKTVYGTVTLSGSVTDERARTAAENLAANARGVKKVVDELQLGSGSQTADGSQPVSPNGNGPAPMVLLSDGTYGPAPAGGTVDQMLQNTAQANGQPTGENANDPAPGTAPATGAQMNDPEHDNVKTGAMPAPALSSDGQASQPQQGYPQQGGYPAQSQEEQPGNTAGNGQYPQPADPYGRRPMYPYPYPQQQAPYGYPQGQQPQAGYAPQQGQAQMGGQAAGQAVAIPAGALLRVRINRTLASNKTQPGTTFDGVVMNDVVANGLVAIPRGAMVQGKVVDAKGSGALTGRGEMSIQLTQVTLAGRVYPLNSDMWTHHGGDKTIETVNKTAGLGVLGAVVGAVAGGGKGAAIGGGVGAAAGLGSSAASGSGQVFIPAEAIVTFHTAGENQVATVSEQEMQRLAYAAGPGGGDQPPVRRVYRVYPGYYPGYPPPGYYPYSGYGYPNY